MKLRIPSTDRSIRLSDLMLSKLDSGRNKYIKEVKDIMLNREKETDSLDYLDQRI